MIATFTVPTDGFIANRYTVESGENGITIEHEMVDDLGRVERSCGVLCIELEAIGAVMRGLERAAREFA